MASYPTLFPRECRKRSCLHSRVVYAFCMRLPSADCFSLKASVRIMADDRARPERLLRYCAWSAFAPPVRAVTRAALATDRCRRRLKDRIRDSGIDSRTRRVVGSTARIGQHLRPLSSMRPTGYGRSETTAVTIRTAAA